MLKMEEINVAAWIQSGLLIFAAIVAIVNGIGALRKFRTESATQKHIAAIEKRIVDIEKKQTEHSKELDDLKDDVKINTSDRKITLCSLLAIIKHLRTGNCTGKMDEAADSIEKYLVETR